VDSDAATLSATAVARDCDVDNINTEQREEAPKGGGGGMAQDGAMTASKDGGIPTPRI
jgi:hypothetical protein